MGLISKATRNLRFLSSAFVLFIFITATAAVSTAGMSTPQINENKGLGLTGPVVENSQFTGAAIVSIPILVPPGRNGIAPRLSLTYNSFQKNGWLGVGWDLDMGSIQRSTKFGVCYDCDDYVAKKSGSSSVLVPRNDWGQDYYGAKIEGGFSKYFKDSAGGWIVYAKDGSKYSYGTFAWSRAEAICREISLVSSTGSLWSGLWNWSLSILAFEKKLSFPTLLVENVFDMLL